MRDPVGEHGEAVVAHGATLGVEVEGLVAHAGKRRGRHGCAVAALQRLLLAVVVDLCNTYYCSHILYINYMFMASCGVIFFIYTHAINPL